MSVKNRQYNRNVIVIRDCHCRSIVIGLLSQSYSSCRHRCRVRCSQAVMTVSQGDRIDAAVPCTHLTCHVRVSFVN